MVVMLELVMDLCQLLVSQLLEVSLSMSVQGREKFRQHLHVFLDMSLGVCGLLLRGLDRDIIVFTGGHADVLYVHIV